MTKTFKEIIAGIRTAILGREVREDIAQGMEYVEQFAETCIAKAREAAQSAAQALQALKDTLAAKTEAVQAISTEKQTGLDAISTAKSSAVSEITTAGSDAVKETQDAHTEALQDISDARTGALNDVANSTKTATEAASTATQKAGEAAASAADAEQAKTDAEAAATAAGESQAAAEGAQEKAEAAAALAGSRAGTDKTLTIEDAPADAKATGDALAAKADAETVNNALAAKADDAAIRNALKEALAEKLGLHDTADDSTKWAGRTLRLEHNTSDTWLPVFCEDNVDYVLKSEIVPAKLGQSGNPDIPMQFNWSGQNGQPTWLWGGNDGTNMYAYNPSNFSVNYANNAGNGLIAASGNYARFGGGIQICFGWMQVDAASWIAFPVPFNATPAITLTRGYSMAYQSSNNVGLWFYNQNNTGFNVSGNKPDSQTGKVIYGYYIAVGTWG